MNMTRFAVLFVLILALVGCSSTPSDKPDDTPTATSQDAAAAEARAKQFEDLTFEVGIIQGNLERAALNFKELLEAREWDLAEKAFENVTKLTDGLIEVCEKAIEVGMQSDNPDVQDVTRMLRDTAIPLLRRSLEKYGALIEEGRQMDGR